MSEYKDVKVGNLEGMLLEKINPSYLVTQGHFMVGRNERV